MRTIWTVWAVAAILATIAIAVVGGAQDTQNRKLTPEEITRIAQESDREIWHLFPPDFEKRIQVGTWLVFFGARWCKFCKRLTPKWLEVQRMYTANNLISKDFYMTKVDCTNTTMEEWCSKNYRVDGYPTIYLFSKGQFIEEYTGVQEVGSIYSYIENKIEYFEAKDKAAKDEGRVDVAGAGTAETPKAEEIVIKWSIPGGFSDLFEMGIIHIRYLEYLSSSQPESAAISLPEPSRIVFLISTHIARHADIIRSVILSNPYRECRIFAALPETLHAAEIDMEPDLAMSFDAYLGYGNGYFACVEDKMYSWMRDSCSRRGQQQKDVRVVVEHLPLLYSILTPEFFTIPSSLHIFPSIYQTERSSITKSLDAPTSFDKQTRQLAFSLCALLESWGAKEELFVMGDLSKQIARCVVSQSMNAPRRKSESHLAVILVDRTLDLAAPCSHSDNLIDQMNRILERVEEDVLDFQVNSNLLLSDQDESGTYPANCSIAHGADSECMDLLTVLSTLSQKDGMVVVRKRLVDLIAREAPEMKPKVLGKLTLVQMEKLLGVFKDNEKLLAKHGNLLQCLTAAVQVFREALQMNWEDLMAAEKVIAGSLAETEDISSVIEPVRDVLARAAEAPTMSSPRNSRVSVEASLQSLNSRSSSSGTIEHAGSTSFSIKDALLLTAYSFALMGTLVPFSQQDESALVQGFTRAAMAAMNHDTAMSPIRDKPPQQKMMEIEAWIQECVHRLKRISRLREKLSQFGNLLSPDSPSPYQSLVRRVLSESLSATAQPLSGAATVAGAVIGETEDLAHVPYGGTLGSVLTGFRSLLGAKPRPSQYTAVLVFVVGGITMGEVRDVREVARETGKKVIMDFQWTVPKLGIEHYGNGREVLWYWEAQIAANKNQRATLDPAPSAIDPRQSTSNRRTDIFRIQVISSTDVRSPITAIGSTAFFHHKHENIYLVAVSKTNANAALMFEYLYKVTELGRSYFGKFDEEAVKNNFTLIYELMDEICDFGFPQNTEPETLKLYITTEGVKSDRAVLEEGSKIAIQATGAVSWRRPDIKYRKNEAFIDVVESVNLLMSAKGATLRADVSGQILMRAYLSGMPECKFGLNDRVVIDSNDQLNARGGGSLNGAGGGGGARATSVELDDAQFHQCVRLANFEENRTINFIPPDGEFELMRYRSTNNVHLPFRVHAVVNELSNVVEYKISIRALFDSKIFAQNVVIKIPTPPNTASAKTNLTAGRAKYVGSENAIVWKITKFQGHQEYLISCEAELTPTTNKKAWSRPPISMDFQVLMFTSSGLMVRYLKIFEKSNYQSVKWVRYMTKAGSYQIRF
ncbi:hypothetical protein HDV05_005181 [Chytridiales sp. JEL 0842]|nr:hypothetical protein HDV05_005181 [Chytridiales sp. JEL 0842]